MFNIPEDFKNAMKGSMDSGGGVTLPFPHVFFSFRNGNRVVGKEKGEQFYGGFQADQEDVVSWLESVDKRDAIKNFNLHELTPRVGDPYMAYMRRAMAIAPITVRSRWFKNKDAKNILKAQVVGLLGLGKPLESIGAVVLTASGYNQANNLLDALKANERASAQARRDFGQNAPVNFFYQFLGTFGEEGVFEMVGKGDNKSPITPIQSWSSKIETEKALSELFVGDHQVPTIAEYKKLSEEWVADWKKKEENKLPEDAPNFGEPTEENPFDSEIPF